MERSRKRCTGVNWQIMRNKSRKQSSKKGMGKKDADFDAELKEVLGKMYEKYVPQAVREYIESRGDVPPAIKKANRQQGKNSVASGSAAENE